MQQLIVRLTTDMSVVSFTESMAVPGCSVSAGEVMMSSACDVDDVILFADSIV